MQEDLDGINFDLQSNNVGLLGEFEASAKCFDIYYKLNLQIVEGDSHFFSFEFQDSFFISDPIPNSAVTTLGVMSKEKFGIKEILINFSAKVTNISKLVYLLTLQNKKTFKKLEYQLKYTNFSNLMENIYNLELRLTDFDLKEKRGNKEIEEAELELKKLSEGINEFDSALRNDSTIKEIDALSKKLKEIEDQMNKSKIQERALSQKLLNADD